jgi:serine/threonine protein kinase
MECPIYDAKHRYETSFLDSIRPSRLHDYDDANTTVGQSLERYTSLTSQYTTLEALISILTWIGLPGPAVLLGDVQYIGSGSQFIVYKQTLVWTDSGKNPFHRDVATKQPKFPLDSNSKLNLAEPEIRQHLQHMLLEILALRDRKLRAHPNIANLIGWSSQTRAFHQPVLLLMELADHNLATYLGSHAADISLYSKYWIFHDIASGLDAIHENKLIHGDLKPGNILLYYERGRLVAKLADFGSSMEESACKEKEARLAGTLGWQAPEVETG